MRACIYIYSVVCIIQATKHTHTHAHMHISGHLFYDVHLHGGERAQRQTSIDWHVHARRVY